MKNIDYLRSIVIENSNLKANQFLFTSPPNKWNPFGPDQKNLWIFVVAKDNEFKELGAFYLFPNNGIDEKEKLTETHKSLLKAFVLNCLKKINKEDWEILLSNTRHMQKKYQLIANPFLHRIKLVKGKDDPLNKYHEGAVHEFVCQCKKAKLKFALPNRRDWFIEEIISWGTISNVNLNQKNYILIEKGFLKHYPGGLKNYVSGKKYTPARGENFVMKKEFSFVHRDDLKWPKCEKCNRIVRDIEVTLKQGKNPEHSLFMISGVGGL